jgi:hypothetical protein
MSPSYCCGDAKYSILLKMAEEKRITTVHTVLCHAEPAEV